MPPRMGSAQGAPRLEGYATGALFRRFDPDGLAAGRLQHRFQGSARNFGAGGDAVVIGIDVRDVPRRPARLPCTAVRIGAYS